MHLTALCVVITLCFTTIVTGATTCNQDNVLRGLKNPTNSVIASAFCSTYIRPTITVQTTITTTPVSTTFTTLPNDVTTLSLTTVETSTNTIFTTFSTIVVVDVTSSVTYQSQPLAFTTPPKGVFARAPTLDASAFSQKLATVPASRISSACSCLVSPSPTLTIVQTATNTVTTTLTSDIGPLGTDTLTSLTTSTASVDDLEILTSITTTTEAISTVTATLPPLPVETVICALPGGENAAAVANVLFAGNGIGFNDCLQRCKDYTASPPCKSIFWFGDVTDGVITCRLVGLTAAESINPALVGLQQAFYFSDRDCPLVVGPIGF